MYVSDAGLICIWMYTVVMKCIILDTTDLSEKTVLDDAICFLPVSRKDKASRFVNPNDAALSTCAGLIIEWIRVKFTNGSELRNDEYGKPYFIDSSVHFNISHSGKYVLAAVSDSPVGVDIQKHDGESIDYYLDSLSTYERRIIATVDERNRTDLFYRTWSAKESYVKAIGLGLSKDTRSFSVILDVQNKVIDSDTRFGKWDLYEIECDGGYSAFVCSTEAVPGPLHPRRIHVKEILNELISDRRVVCRCYE